MVSARFARLVAATVLVFASAAMVGCGGGSSGGDSGSTQKKVVLLSAGTSTVGAYELSHRRSFERMCSKYDFKCTIVDNTDYAVAGQTLTRLATSGTDLVIANSSGFADALKQVAPDHPDTWFVMTSDIDSTKGFKNIAGFINNWQEFGYLGGMAAAYISKSKVFGFANGEPLEVSSKIMGGFIDGARSISPDAKLLVRYTNSFTDTTLTREATLAMLHGGADVVSGVSGSATPGTIQAVKQANVSYIGYYADEHQEAPCCVRTSMVVNTMAQYDDIGRLYTNGHIEPKLYTSTVENHGITLAPLRGVPKATAEKIHAVEKKIAHGDIKVHSKPYKGT